jgi:hypothetical protein
MIYRTRPVPSMVRIVDVVLGLGRWPLGHQKLKRGSNTRASLLGLSAARPGIRRWAPGTMASGHNAAYVGAAGLSDGGRGVRDSKNPTGPALTFTATEWDAFTAGVRTGEIRLIENTNTGSPVLY